MSGALNQPGEVACSRISEAACNGSLENRLESIAYLSYADKMIHKVHPHCKARLMFMKMSIRVRPWALSPDLQSLGQLYVIEYARQPSTLLLF
jgi:hypothetical protein